VTEEFLRPHKEVAFASDGPMGKFDRAQLQRGLQVYKEVCSACHSLSRVAFRDLTKLGYSEAQVKKFAADWGAKQQVLDPKTGDRTERDNVPADKFPTVYYPGQGVPPDLSLITKARHGGAAYVYSLLTGYSDQPAALLKHFPDAKTPDGLYYNPYFANLNIAMPAPLADGSVTYADGTKNTLDQMSKDVAAFLVWTAEPELEQRHSTGFAVLGFLLIGTLLAYGSYRTVWRNVKH
ncbi:MAG: cytochrome c1, partial [Sphingomonas sp.]|nr:cytochrome c1 [Sphingomonas sp.]